MSYPISHYLPELDGPEKLFIECLTAGMSEPDVQHFAIAYRRSRKDPQTILLMAVIGIVAVPGLHRFALGQVGLGFLYLVTYGPIAVWHDHRHRKAQGTGFYLQSQTCTANLEYSRSTGKRTRSSG